MIYISFFYHDHASQRIQNALQVRPPSTHKDEFEIIAIF